MCVCVCVCVCEQLRPQRQIGQTLKLLCVHTHVTAQHQRGTACRNEETQEPAATSVGWGKHMRPTRPLGSPRACRPGSVSGLCAAGWRQTQVGSRSPPPDGAGVPGPGPPVRREDGAGEVPVRRGADDAPGSLCSYLSGQQARIRAGLEPCLSLSLSLCLSVSLSLCVSVCLCLNPPLSLPPLTVTRLRFVP